jgi:polyisoprenoid-binding protein YceI
MSTIAAQPFSGTYRADPAHSSFAFSVRHSGVYTFRGSLSDVAATLRANGAAPTLEGSGRVESISVVEPPEFRAQVLGPEFFDAEHHPEIAFRSTGVRLDSDGRVEVDGELTIKGVTRAIAATGHYEAPRPGPFNSVAAGLALQTTIDRRDFGFAFQMALPDGGDLLGWDVQLDIELRLLPDDEAGEQ